MSRHCSSFCETSRHAVIGVIQIECLLQAEHTCDLGVVALVAEDMVADAAGRSQARRIAHVIVRRPQQVAGAALLDKLGHDSRGHQRDVVGVGLDRQQHLSLVRRPFSRAFDEYIARLLLRSCILGINEGGTGAGQPRRKNSRDDWEWEGLVPCAVSLFAP